MCHGTKCDRVCVWFDILSMQFICAVCGYLCVNPYEKMYGGPPHIAKLPRGCVAGRGMQTSQSSDTVPPHSCCFLGQSRTQRLLSPSVSVEDKVCVCVCALHPSVHNQCNESGTSSRHIYTSPSSTSTCHFLPLTISSRSVYFSKHGCWGAEESGSVARLPRGQEWKDGGRRGTEKGGWEWGLLCQIQLMHFSTIINRQAGQVIPN